MQGTLFHRSNLRSRKPTNNFSHRAGSVFPGRILKGYWEWTEETLVLLDMMSSSFFLAVLSWLPALQMAPHALQDMGTGPVALR